MIGDIVILPFPYADSAESKDRPTVVLAYVGDGRYSDWIVCPVTTSRVPYSRAISISEVDIVAGRLRPGSKVRPDRLATFSRSRFGNTIARLSQEKTDEILAAVRGLF